MDAIKVILNPAAGQGHAAKVEPDVRQALSDVGLEFDLTRTERPWHAAELAERAAAEGWPAVVAVGGDGTVNEVVNGLLAAGEAGQDVVFGVVPAGRGSDFASNVGVPNDVRTACRRLAAGRTRRVDLGRLSVDGASARYFANILGVGFDAIVTVESGRLKRLRGLAVYLLAVLRTIFLYHRAPQVHLEADELSLTLPALMICVGNGAREGGGFYVTPQAQPDDGVFDLCIARQVSQLEMFRLIPRFLKGTHVNHAAVTMTRARQVRLTSEGNLVAHADGEVLCTAAHRLECALLPQRLAVYC